MTLRRKEKAMDALIGSIRRKFQRQKDKVKTEYTH